MVWKVSETKRCFAHLSCFNLFHHDLLGLDVVALDELEHIDTVAEVELFVVAAVEAFGAEGTSGDIHDFEGSLSFDAKDLQAVVADESEVVAIDAVAGGEDQFEARSVVGGLSVEAVARVVEEVDIVAGEVVDEVEVAELDVVVVEADGVAAVLLSLEVDRHFAFVLSIDHSVVLAFQRDVDLGATFSELELGQLAAFAEADDGAVQEGC